MEKVIEVLMRVSPLNKKDIDSIISITEPLTLKKGEYWIQAGKSNRNIGFVESGYLRKYYTKEGEEITDYFYFDNDFTADIPSILSNTAPLADITAMKDSTLRVMPYDKLTELCNSSHNIERLLRLVIGETFRRYYNRTTGFLLQSPKERYLQLIESRKDIMQQASLAHIASFLGITPQHLSRIRKSLS